MIEGVQIKQLIRHHDERGYFQENIRVTDDFFSEGFGQWSESEMYQGVVKAWHIHYEQVDWWHCTCGVIKAVLCDLRDFIRVCNKEYNPSDGCAYWDHFNLMLEKHKRRFGVDEHILGSSGPQYILKIPPGVAHGCKVLQGPAKLSYITSKVYNPDDEGRIPHDALGYDWLKDAEIK